MTVKQVKKFLEKIEEETDIRFTIMVNGNNAKKKYGYVVEGEYWSHLGEDVIISLVIEKPTIEEVVREMSNYVDDFDPEEHAAQWYDFRGEHGAPTSLRALLEDADEQAETLKEVYTVMKRLKNQN